MKFPFTRKHAPQTNPPRDGILLGYPPLSGELNDDDLNKYEYIALEALKYHSLIVGKPESGKATLLKLLSIVAMERDMSLIVLDGRGDLASDLVGYVPARRVEETTYFDFGDTQRVIGLNVLDPSLAQSDSLIVETVLQANEWLWKNSWTVYHEDFWRTALYTLMAINDHLRQEHRQLFTLLDVIALFGLPNFRRRLLGQYLDESELLTWWAHYYEPMPNGRRTDLTSSFLAQVSPLAANPLTRNILGQPHATINFRELLSDRRITLVNLAQSYLPNGVGEWLGMILSQLLLSAALERKGCCGTPSASQLLVVLTGFQPVPLIEQMNQLPHLEKSGMSFLFALDSLAQLDLWNPSLSCSLFAGVSNLFVFQTTHRDSERLAGELGADLKSIDLVGLSQEVCYARTRQDRAILPGRRVKTMQPLALESATVREQILNRMSSYTLPAHEVAQTRRLFEETWHGREDTLYRRIMLDQDIKEPPKKSGEDLCQP